MAFKADSEARCAASVHLLKPTNRAAQQYRFEKRPIIERSPNIWLGSNQIAGHSCLNARRLRPDD